jgi:hypothetical protein
MSSEGCLYLWLFVPFVFASFHDSCVHLLLDGWQEEVKGFVGYQNPQDCIDGCKYLFLGVKVGHGFRIPPCLQENTNENKAFLHDSKQRLNETQPSLYREFLLGYHTFLFENSL